MKSSAALNTLVEAIKSSGKPAEFAATGQLPHVAPELSVTGLGQIKFPLQAGDVKRLLQACHVAPYGQGTKTLVNRKVRNTWELDATELELSERWQALIQLAARDAADKLGLPAEQVTPQLYKLLVYEKGGFFLPHRDSEKLDRMVATMIVVLPSAHYGGELTVKHGKLQKKFDFHSSHWGTQASYVAFYADCEHEVAKVTQGTRICLAYNLVLNTSPRSAKSTAPAAVRLDPLAQAMYEWTEDHPQQPMIFALEHHYTQRGLAVELLKGPDRKLAQMVLAAAEHVTCEVRLAQVEGHRCWDAFDENDDYYGRRGRYGRGRYRYDDDEEDDDDGDIEYQVNDLIDESWHLDHWTTVQGTSEAWGSVGFAWENVISTQPIDQWKPSEEQFEGYTGNAGNTLDRWYRRSALVVMRADDRYTVFVRDNAVHHLPTCTAMIAKLAKTPQKRRDAARDECWRFARAIVAHWPRLHWDQDYPAANDSALMQIFLAELHSLGDVELLKKILRAAVYDSRMPLAEFVVAIGAAHGWLTFQDEWTALFERPLDVRRESALRARDIEWLSALADDGSNDPVRRKLTQQLSRVAVAQFTASSSRTSRSTSFVNYDEDDDDDSTSTHGQHSTPLKLLQTLLACELLPEFTQVIDFIRTQPARFDRDRLVIPLLCRLVPWSLRRCKQVPAALQAWLDDVREELQSAVDHPPQPPGDWRRPAEIKCKCRLCQQLAEFLTDAEHETATFRESERERNHLIDSIERHRCDVGHSLIRQGRPYGLLLRKNTDSYRRAVRQNEQDRKLLALLRKLRA